MRSVTICGRNPVLEALRSGRRLRSLTLLETHKPDARTRDIVDMAEKAEVPVRRATRAELDALSGGRAHQGVVAEAEPREQPALGEFLAGLDGRSARLVLLDGMTDPQNLGTILRVADGAGVAGVIVPRRRSARLTATVAKASAGAVEYVPVIEVPNLNAAIARVKEAGFWTVCADPSGGESLYDIDLTGRIALVVGAEGRGVSRLVRESCDFAATIPMLGRTQSLNAAVAGALVLYEAVRQSSAASTPERGARPQAGGRGPERAPQPRTEGRGSGRSPQPRTEGRGPGRGPKQRTQKPRAPKPRPPKPRPPKPRPAKGGRQR